jgi:hypothetical protein
MAFWGSHGHFFMEIQMQPMAVQSIALADS